MNVLHLVEHFYQGGIERLLDQIAVHTLANEARISVYTYQTKVLEGIGKALAAKGIPVFTYDKRVGYDLSLVRDLVRVVKEQRIDVVHTHDFGPTEYAVALKLRFPRLRLVHTHHTLHDFLRHRKYILFFQFASLFYHRLIGVSDHVTETLKRICPLTRGKVVTIVNGLDVARFRDVSPAPLRSPLRLVNISRVSPEKNLLHALAACRRLKEDGVQFHFHHAGTGDAVEEERVRSFVTRAGLAGEVTLHGFHEDIRPILAQGNVFVSPSKTEGLPVAVLEAMASGLLCVCSDIPPHRQLSEKNILFFPLDEDSLPNLLKEIARQPDRYAALPARAQAEVAERFSLRRMLEAYGNTYA